MDLRLEVAAIRQEIEFVRTTLINIRECADIRKELTQIANEIENIKVEGKSQNLSTHDGSIAPPKPSPTPDHSECNNIQECKNTNTPNVTNTNTSPADNFTIDERKTTDQPSHSPEVHTQSIITENNDTGKVSITDKTPIEKDTNPTVNTRTESITYNDSNKVENEGKSGETERKPFEGYLHKKGGVRKNWKKRWFVLRDGVMHYYEHNQSTKPKGTVQVSGQKCGPVGPTGTASKYPNAFVVHNPKRIYYIFADTPAVLQAWKNSIINHGGQWSEGYSEFEST